CPSCGFESPPGFKFCGQCGTPLAAAEPPPAAQAERRQITVMFCDLVGSTSLSERLDPEELRELLQAYQGVCAREIEQQEGHIAQYLGDGILAYFGYPQAHPDDALRAVRASQGILQGVRDLNVSVRVGLHTGVVVVGEVGAGDRREHLALGETPNVAARVQSAAAPDSIIISRATFALVQDRLVCNDLGVLTLKGLTRPFRLYRVERELDPRMARAAARERRSHLPMVGRELERTRLMQAWERGGAVYIGGESGVGKSRMLQELKDHVSQQGAYLFSMYCTPDFRNSALYPLVDLLEREFRVDPGDSPEVRWNKVAEGLRRRAPQVSLDHAMPRLAGWLSLTLPPGVEPPNLQPQAVRQQAMQLVVVLLRSMAGDRQVLLAVDDMHYADPSTQEFLTLLAGQVGRRRILVVATGPPTFRPLWPESERIDLPRLSRASAEELILKVARRPLPREVMDYLVGRADGIPLFAEEYTRMALDSGLLVEEEGRLRLTGSVEELGIPPTLQDFLMARLDCVGPSKELAQRAAVYGQHVGHRFLELYAGLESGALQAHLDRLIEEGILLQLESVYAFSHGLLQQAAYLSLLKSVRQTCHGTIARLLEESFPDIVESQPEVVAHHHFQAGKLAPALGYWARAGGLALHRSANHEAVTHFQQALEALSRLPDSDRGTELQLVLGKAAALIPSRGYAAPEVVEAYSRARELCRVMGDPVGLFGV
ncbi:MAG: adenylate/guanylate cyclase domain-containing protein, partial [Candidatus Eremiobacterota bacterium]